MTEKVKELLDHNQASKNKSSQKGLINRTQSMQMKYLILLNYLYLIYLIKPNTYLNVGISFVGETRKTDEQTHEGEYQWAFKEIHRLNVISVLQKHFASIVVSRKHFNLNGNHEEHNEQWSNGRRGGKTIGSNDNDKRT